MKKQDLRIAFMGTPEFAKKSLEGLIENKYNVVGVFCQPDRPAGRGMKLTKPPVKVLAEENNIPVFQPEKIKNNEDVDRIKIDKSGKETKLGKNIIPNRRRGCT